MTITSAALRRPSSTAQAFLMRDDNAGQEWGKGFRDASEASMSVSGSTGGKAFLARVAGEGSEIACAKSAPSPCITAAHEAGKYRAWLEQGRVVSMSPRALGRFMTLPDWYVLPEKKKLASTIIGNGFPCLAAEKIMRQLREAIC